MAAYWQVLARRQASRPMSRDSVKPIVPIGTAINVNIILVKASMDSAVTKNGAATPTRLSHVTYEHLVTD